jgi:Cu-Zn family superoxide dismutase
MLRLDNTILTEGERKMKNRSCLFLLSILALSFVLMGCTSLGLTPAPKVTKAVAVLRPIQGSNVSGKIVFLQEGSKVRIIADVTGLSPGKHGIHIHEFGDCTTPDGMGAGGHFNPNNKRHGGPDDDERHLGDLGNLDADKNGKAKYDRLNDRISLTGRNSIIGRSVVIKERADDFTTQPGGNAGARIACGVIGVASSPLE